MKKYMKKLLYLLRDVMLLVFNTILPERTKENIRQWVYNLCYKKYPIIKRPDQELNLYCHINDARWETAYLPEIYGIAKEREITCAWPEENFFLIKNAVVCYDSDIVITPKGVYWSKYNEDDFTSGALPYDRNLKSFNKDYIFIKPNKKKVFIKGRTLSLIGKFSYYWSHFLFEFICKMYYAGELGLFNTPINILTDKTNDNNIEELINTYLAKYPNVQRINVLKNVDYQCEELLCMRETGSNYNEMKFTLLHRFTVPNSVTSMLQKYISNPYTNKLRRDGAFHKKLFLSRHGKSLVNGRTLRNIEEVENYFKEQGFYFVEGAELSLAEKAELFFHAEYIVGLHGSAWQNTIFCKDAKCLQITNHRYVEESIFYTLSKNNVKRWINVTGIDDNAFRNSDFYIPLGKIIAAYDLLLNDSDNKPL